MGVHCTARLSWHDDGWNGRVCKNAKANVYCVGSQSFRRTYIRENRNLEYEMKKGVAGEFCLNVEDIEKIPPCCHSCNAFGRETIKGYAEVPEWFEKSAQTKFFDLPPSTIAIWPYEGMYSDDVKIKEGNKSYDYGKRLKNASDFFDELEAEKSFVVYYTNFSNPFSEDDSPKRVITGVSRISKIGQTLYYDGVSEKDKKNNAGGFVWFRTITSTYPSEGFCIPFHKYRDDKKILDNLLINTENPELLQYYCKHVSDDQMINIFEQFNEIIDYLIEIGDKSENWIKKKEWILSCISELWIERGPYPGLAKVLDYLKFSSAIEFYKKESKAENSIQSYEKIMDFLNGKNVKIPGADDYISGKIIRKWKNLPNDAKTLMQYIFPRMDISKDQMLRILNHDRIRNNIKSSLSEICDNPYLICEQYIGDNQDDRISFAMIDNALIPSSELKLDGLAYPDDAERLRALMIDILKKENKHSYLPLNSLLNKINKKIKNAGSDRSHIFNLNNFVEGKDVLSKFLEFKNQENEEYIYLKNIFELERIIESELKAISSRPDIQPRIPVSDNEWIDYLRDSESKLNKKGIDIYNSILEKQSLICKQIFSKPLSVIYGTAGTGKTTIVGAIIDAIEKSQGIGTSFQLLAPTGKATDRLREKTGKTALTLHSFLAQRGWLNDNMSFKSEGEKKESGYSTYIIDESSMIDLELLGTFFKSLNWDSVERIIFIGDPNQLPPIGIGKPFIEIIDWLKENKPENVAMLSENVRQLETEILGKGNSILKLASLYTRSEFDEDHFELRYQAEEIFDKIQFGGDIDEDLRVIYWKDDDELEKQIKEEEIKIIRKFSKRADNANTNNMLWYGFIERIKEESGEIHQILSPRRGDLFGTERINEFIQKTLLANYLTNKGTVSGITINDKVIQRINRTKSNPYWAYNHKLKKSERIEAFNGEIGYVYPYQFNNYEISSNNKRRINRFTIVFNPRKDYSIDFKSESAVTENIELAYAISVHKSQGSEFDHVFLVIPKKVSGIMSKELLYTGLTRAKKHLTIFIQEDISSLYSLFRSESSVTKIINSSIFFFEPVPEEIISMEDWYEEGKIHRTLSYYMVRSKSEVIIANILYDRNISFYYEKPLKAPDGTQKLPDFTIQYDGTEYYLEHLGMLDKPEYAQKWEEKRKWYDKWFPNKLLFTTESSDLSIIVDNMISEKFSGQQNTNF